MGTIGERLKEERLRLGLSQPKFAAIGGVQKSSQVNYESNLRKPDAGYLENIAKIGGDVQYIITGVRGVITHVESFPKIEGLEEISVEDLEKTLEIVKVQYMGMIKLMKKVRKVNAE